MTHAERAAAIHRDLPVVDGHNDLPWAIRTRAGGSLDSADPSGPLEGYHTDLLRLLRGGVGLQFWSVFVPAWNQSPLRTTLEQIDLVERMSKRAAGLTAVARTAAEAAEIRASGRVAGVLGAEGGHCIEYSLGGLHRLAARGVRYLTLTHADTTDWADAATDEPRHGGLSDFGREVVREMNRLGMLVDISHVAVATMHDTLEVSEAPIIASHSNAHVLAAHPRNLPDDVIAGVAEGGGVVMVSFVPAFLVPATAQLALDMFDRERELRARFDPDDEAGFTAARDEMFAGLDIDAGTVADVADHIEHVARVGGVDHVGIGSDFDGVERLPVGLEDASCYPALTAELLRRGWTERDVRKVLGDNARRVLAAAEDVAG